MLTDSPTATDVTLVDARMDTAADVYVDPSDHAIAAVVADDLEAGTPLADPAEDFVVVDGVAAMEGEHASRVVDGADARWERCDAPGRQSGRTMALALSVFPSREPDDADAPELAFDVDFATGSKVSVNVHCLPTQSICEGQGLRYALAVVDGAFEAVSVDPAGDEHDMRGH